MVYILNMSETMSAAILLNRYHNDLIVCSIASILNEYKILIPGCDNVLVMRQSKDSSHTC